jgi:hypothetical protein
VKLLCDPLKSAAQVEMNGYGNDAPPPAIPFAACAGDASAITAATAVAVATKTFRIYFSYRYGWTFQRDNHSKKSRQEPHIMTNLP